MESHAPDWLKALDAATCATLVRYRFDLDTFLALQKRLRESPERDAMNRLRVPMCPPRAHDIVRLPRAGTAARAHLKERGEAIVARGELAVALLAGGMATRFGGVVKACAEALPGRSFLALKLDEVRRVAERCEGFVPVCLMSSFATASALDAAAAATSHARVPVRTFAQSVALRVMDSGDLFRDRHHDVSLYTPGHGDFADALAHTGTHAWLTSRGVKYLAMANIDNLAATLDPALVALHAELGCAITFEVVDFRPGDQGGAPARVDDKLQVVEALREPLGFARASIPLFSTNCMVFELATLRATFPLSWFAVEKTVDERPAIQFERFVNQLTAFLPCRAVHVERDGAEGRFLPIKTPGDLRDREAQIRALHARAR